MSSLLLLLLLLLLLRLPSRLHPAGTLLRVERSAEGRRNASVTAGTTRNARYRLHTMSLVRAAAGRQAAQGVCGRGGRVWSAPPRVAVALMRTRPLQAS